DSNNAKRDVLRQVLKAINDIIDNPQNQQAWGQLNNLVNSSPWMTNLWNSSIKQDGVRDAGNGCIWSSGDYQALAKNAQSCLDSLGNVNEVITQEVQQQANTVAMADQLRSNIDKKFNDTAMSIVRNVA